MLSLNTKYISIIWQKHNIYVSMCCNVLHLNIILRPQPAIFRFTIPIVFTYLSYIVLRSLQLFWNIKEKQMTTWWYYSAHLWCFHCYTIKLPHIHNFKIWDRTPKYVYIVFLVYMLAITNPLYLYNTFPEKRVLKYCLCVMINTCTTEEIIINYDMIIPGTFISDMCLFIFTIMYNYINIYIYIRIY